MKKAWEGDMFSARFLELLAGQVLATASGTKAGFLFGAAADLLSAQLLQVDEGQPVEKTDEPVKIDEGEPVKTTKVAKEARAQGSKTANVVFARQVKKDKAEGPPKKKAACLVRRQLLITYKRAARQESVRTLQSSRQRLSAHCIL